MAIKHITCRECGAQFKHNVVSRPPAYCTKACKAASANRRARVNRPKPSPITYSMTVVCEGCGTKGAPTNRGLCAECNKSQRLIARSIAHRTRRGVCDLPPRLVAVRPERTLTCPECSEAVQYVPHFGEDTRTYCTRKCQKKATDRVSTRARRALERGCKADRIDPNMVFDRDGWRCQLCRCKTPRSKRGTYDNNAPELDHVLPLSLGGEHTYRNTQLLCRACNASKSNRPLGQLSLL